MIGVNNSAQSKQLSFGCIWSQSVAKTPQQNLCFLARMPFGQTFLLRTLTTVCRCFKTSRLSVADVCKCGIISWKCRSIQTNIRSVNNSKHLYSRIEVYAFHENITCQVSTNKMNQLVRCMSIRITFSTEYILATCCMFLFLADCCPEFENFENNIRQCNCYPAELEKENCHCLTLNYNKVLVDDPIHTNNSKGESNLCVIYSFSNKTTRTRHC